MRQLNVRVEGLIDELDANARRDPLTGALNRRGLDERLGIELTRARRIGEPLTVIIADLDGLEGRERPVRPRRRATRRCSWRPR